MTASMHSLRHQKDARSHAPARRAHREPYLALHASGDATSKAPAEAGRKEEHFKHYAESHAWKRRDESTLRSGAEQSRTKRYLRASFMACLGIFSAACAAIVLVSILQPERNGAHLNETPMTPSSVKTAVLRGISPGELPYEERRLPSLNDKATTQPIPKQNAVPAKLTERDTSLGGAAFAKSGTPQSLKEKETSVSKPMTKAKPVMVKEKEVSKPRKRPTQAKKRQEFERLQQQAADEMLRNLQMTGH